MSEVFLTREEIEHPYANLAVMLEDKRKKAEQMHRTVFDRITQSPEVLAEKLVYSTYIKIKKPLYDWKRRQIANRWVLRGVWGSSVTDETYSTKAEAIAATVAKLKEVCNG